jgi:hypothetical protein
MNAEACFPDPIQLRDGGLVGGTRIFILEHYFRYVSSKGIIVVPTGFRTDGASIPKVFWSILGPHGSYFSAAIVHDFLYSKASNATWCMSRKDADDLFLEAMWNAGVGWHRNIIHAAVRCGGWRSFKAR